jgi:hypothetical protein
MCSDVQCSDVQCSDVQWCATRINDLSKEAILQAIKDKDLRFLQVCAVCSVQCAVCSVQCAVCSAEAILPLSEPVYEGPTFKLKGHSGVNSFALWVLGNISGGTVLHFIPLYSEGSIRFLWTALNIYCTVNYVHFTVWLLTQTVKCMYCTPANSGTPHSPFCVWEYSCSS